MKEGTREIRQQRHVSKRKLDWRGEDNNLFSAQ